MSLQDVVDAIVTPIVKRAEKGLNYGIILIPEGVIEFIPEVKVLISSINTLLARKKQKHIMLLPLGRNNMILLLLS